MGKIFRSNPAEASASESKEEGSSHFHGLKNDPYPNGIEPAGNECPRQKSQKGIPIGSGESFFPKKLKSEKTTGIEKKNFDGGKTGESPRGNIPIGSGR
jgi:hypothetical protein